MLQENKAIIAGRVIDTPAYAFSLGSRNFYRFYMATMRTSGRYDVVPCVATEDKTNYIGKDDYMHYCENPFDVLNYYPLVDDKGDMTEFAEVEPLGKVYRKEDKCATNKLHIGAKIGSSGYGAKIGSSKTKRDR